MGVVAIFFGVLLAYLGKKLAVKVDEKEEKVLGLLGGANCGACGKAGCAQFAKALVEGKAQLSECSATNAGNKSLICDILGLNASDEEPQKIVRKCNGGVNCKDNYKYEGIDSCASVAKLVGGNKLCQFGCLGFGDCKKVCPNGSIEIGDSKTPLINEDTCITCGNCVKACPREILAYAPKNAVVAVSCVSRNKGKEVKEACKVGCIACGLCVKACEFDAIGIIANLPIINYSKCTGCKKCAQKCPVHAISINDIENKISD